ncbi:MAG: DmsC/YnfH family molybdoenzyme membrane anchor subunit [Pseudomonadota bacterium]
MLSTVLLTMSTSPSYEFSLVIFTVFSQVSIGLSMVGLIFGRAACRCGGSGLLHQGHSELSPRTISKHARRLRCLWASNALIMTVALVASLFHLGHPSKAHTALLNLQGAWLSREILAFGMYFGLLLITLIAFILKNQALKKNPQTSVNPPQSSAKLIYELASILTVATGIMALIASSLAYTPPAHTAINNILPFIFFTITTLGLGFAFGLSFLPTAHLPSSPQDEPKNAHQKLYRSLACICAATLLVGLVVYLIIPCVWFSGTPIMQLTATQWLASPWFWGHLLFTFLWPLLILWRYARMPRWLPFIMLLGAIMGRMSFFADTVSTAVLIGYPL